MRNQTRQHGRRWPLLILFALVFAIASLSTFSATISKADAVAIGWNFTDLNAAFDTGTPANFSVGDMTIANSFGTVATPISTTSASSGYTGATGTGNIGTAVNNAAFSTASSPYFTTPITPAAGYSLRVTKLDFGMRSTSTGATTYALYSSIDNYGTPIYTGSNTANSAWTLKTNPLFNVNGAANAPVTLRLYTYGGASNAGSGTINTRVDDISLAVEAVPAGPSISISDVSLSEGNAGTTTFSFSVSLSSPAGPGGVTFDIATADGTATQPSDYTAKVLTSQTIPSGSSTYTFDVLVNGDLSPETNETFLVNLSNVSGASVADGQGAGTILNDDAAPNLTISDVSLNEGNAGTTTFSFTVSLSAPAGASGVTFDIGTADGTAAQPSDYTAKALTTQTISAGSSTYTFDVLVNGDTTNESNETFLVNITNITNAVGADVQGTGTIVNDDATRIHDIQGAGASSPLVGQTVTVDAIVVGDFQNGDADTQRDLSGFYLQEENANIDADPATSEGIFVFTSSGTNVALGDRVRVTGNVSEFFGMTEITATTITIVQAGAVANVSTMAVDVHLPAAAVTLDQNGAYQPDLERYEGMLVRIPETLTIAEQFNLDRFNEIKLFAGGRPENYTNASAPSIAGYAAFLQNVGSRKITYDDGLNVQNASVDQLDGFAPYNTATAPRMGDTVTGLTGVLDYQFAGNSASGSTWRVRSIANNSNTFVHTNPRPIAHDPVGGRLKVVSMNVLNYFRTLDTSASATTAIGLEPRGANTAAEFDRQTAKLVHVLLTLNFDLVGLTELENDFQPGSSGNALEYLVNQLNAQTAPGTFAWVNPGTRFVGGDAIAVGFIYKPASLHMAPGTTLERLDDSDVTAFDPALLSQSSIGHIFDGLNTSRNALAVTFAENSTGAVFTTVVNHLKSKSGTGTGADADQLDGQGNWQNQRKLAARALVEWVATDPTHSADPDFLLLGDFNAYVKEDPLAVITGAGFHNLAEDRLPDPYSYVFDAQYGALDHAFANASLNGQVTGVTEWHINADEADGLDYNLDFGRNPAIFDPNVAARESDHDPVVLGLALSVACSPGTFSATGLAPCDPAPAGSYVSVPGATSATPCAAGTYQSLTGQTSCVLAEKGTFVPTAGATMSTPCVAGTYQSLTGQAACVPAPAGSFVSGAGAQAATQCLPGTYQPQTGQTSCLPAPVNTYVATTGATEATPCPAGTYNPTVGAASASACLTGTAPAITSANQVTFIVGTSGTFTVTATGTPTPTLAESGALPSGVTFVASTGVLSGTPAVGSDGVYHITFSATNGIAPDASQPFTLTVVDAAPETTIVSGPAPLTNQTSATFSFASNVSGATFECLLETALDFTTCTNPITFTGLAEGLHTLSVRARSAGGGVDPTPATYSWTVDVTAPNTTFDTTPPDPSAAIAVFAFSADDSPVTFECKLDGAPFTACASPLTLTGLSDGGHTFQVRAIDAAGNVDATPANYTWTVDATPPDTTITAGPNGTVNNGNATFKFTSNQPSSTFECSLDGATFEACASPRSYTGLANGAHTFSVQAIDAVGNIDPTPATRTWTVNDGTAPKTTLISKPAKNASVSSATFVYKGSDNSGAVSFECRLDGGAWVACNTPGSQPRTFQVTYTALAEGSHTFDVRAKDPSGNVDASPVSYSWTVDVTKPVLTYTLTRNDGGAYTPGTWSTVPVRLDIVCTDPGAMASGIAHNRVPAHQTFHNGLTNVPIQGLAPKDCADRAGNAADPVGPFVVKVDNRAPQCTAVPARVQLGATGGMVNVTTTLDTADNLTPAYTQSHGQITFVTGDNGTLPSDIGTSSVDASGVATVQVKAIVGGPKKFRTYTVTFLVSDEAGNTRNCTGRIEVRATGGGAS